MEVSCPQCGQRLRVPEGLRMARVRCRTCEHEFTTSTSDSLFDGRQNLESDRVTRPVEPTAAEVVDEPLPPEHFDSFQMPAISTADPPPKSRSTGWGIAIFILIALITKGPRIIKFFQPQQRPPAPVVRPMNEMIDRQRKLGEDLQPPKKPFRLKFKKPNGEPPAPIEERDPAAPQTKNNPDP